MSAAIFCLVVFVLFCLICALILVALCMNSSRINQAQEHLFEEPLGADQAAEKWLGWFEQ